MPGASGGWVTISDAVKKPVNKDAPLPAAVRNNVAKENLSENQVDQLFSQT